MGANAAIDVAIGLVLMYLVLSLVCTTLNEAIATTLGWRAKTLAASLSQLVDIPRLKADFDNHGLIDGAKNTLKRQDPSYLSGTTFALALLGSLDPTKPFPVFDEIQGAVHTLPDSNIRDVLLSHILTAEKDVSQLRDNIATWFDSAMDRLSGSYKRKVKLWSFIVALTLASMINADSLIVGKALWQDSSLRSEMTQSAGAFLSANTNAQTDTAPNVSGIIDRMKQTDATLRPLPIGWDFSSPFSYWNMSAFSKLFGLLLTAIALSLGAPFWFDLLSKFMRVRGTGTPPKATGDN